MVTTGKAMKSQRIAYNQQAFLNLVNKNTQESKVGIFVKVYGHFQKIHLPATKFVRTPQI